MSLRHEGNHFFIRLHKEAIAHFFQHLSFIIFLPRFEFNYFLFHLRKYKALLDILFILGYFLHLYLFK